MTATPAPAAQASAAPPSPARPANAGYIVSPAFDLPLLVLSPLLALLVGLALFQTPWAELPVRFEAWNPRFVQPLALFLIAVFTHAHLVIVFFRSHGNRSIFELHPIRFRVVPIALLFAMLTWHWAFVAVSVLVVWWDVYHSSLQTFGLGRIYDARAGNPPQSGRRLDYWLNLMLYIGPILSGVNLWEHAKHFESFGSVGSPTLAQLGTLMLQRQPEMRWMVAALALPLLLGTVVFYLRESRAGRYRMPPQKLWLLLCTGGVSVLAWGTLSTGEAFFIMNFFHALQYFAIVWWSEEKTIVRLFGLGQLSLRRLVAWTLLVVPAIGYGLWATVQPGMVIGVVAFSHVVSILHFWYDGFIWSVRRKQV